MASQWRPKYRTTGSGPRAGSSPVARLAATSLVAGLLRQIPALDWAWGTLLEPRRAGVVWRGELVTGLFDHLRILCELTLPGTRQVNLLDLLRLMDRRHGEEKR